MSVAGIAFSLLAGAGTLVLAYLAGWEAHGRQYQREHVGRDVASRYRTGPPG